MRAPVTLSTTFSLDDIGRYVCNTLDEATASQDSSIQHDARPFPRARRFPSGCVFARDRLCG